MKRTIDRVTRGYPRIKIRESRVKIGYHLQLLEKVSRDIILWVLSAVWLYGSGKVPLGAQIIIVRERKITEPIGSLL